MPTASPIMVIINCTKKSNSKYWPITLTAASAKNMAIIAMPNGNRVAATAPKSTSRMISAMGMPKRSPDSRSSVLSSLFSKATLASPPMSTRKSSVPSNPWTTWMTSSMFSMASWESPVRV